MKTNLIVETHLSALHWCRQMSSNNIFYLAKSINSSVKVDTKLIIDAECNITKNAYLKNNITNNLLILVFKK